MKSLLNWHRQRKFFPSDVYTWKSILSERLFEFFTANRFVKFGESTTDFIEINGKDFQIENIDGKYIAFNDETADIELSSKDVLQMYFNKKAFADFVKASLGTSGAVSKIQDGFCLGDLSVGKGYRSFLCFSDSASFTRDIANSLGSFQPLIISFDDISAATQKLLREKDGKAFLLEECFEFCDNSMRPTGLLKDFLKTPKRKQNNTDYYCWKSTGFHQPENPTLNMLKICVLSTSRLRIIFDGEGDVFEYRDINIFRNENTGKMNVYWTCLRLLATGQEISNDYKGKQQSKRLNAAFREFFGFKGKVRFFSFENGLLMANFPLTAKKENYREQKNVINCCLDEESYDFRNNIRLE